MTTTKLAYVVAAIVPFGFVILACLGIAHVAIGGLRTRRHRRQHAELAH
jgi:hypothetical protein